MSSDVEIYNRREVQMTKNWMSNLTLGLEKTQARSWSKKKKKEKRKNRKEAGKHSRGKKRRKKERRSNNRKIRSLLIRNWANRTQMTQKMRKLRKKEKVQNYLCQLVKDKVCWSSKLMLKIRDLLYQRICILTPHIKTIRKLRMENFIKNNWKRGGNSTSE